MAKKGNLFHLIKSLDKPEKRYFKHFCFNRNTNNNYIRLFDAYDAMKTFDDDGIRKKFAGEAFIRQLHVTKNYLNRLILQSLRNYYQGLSKRSELKDLLRNIEILFFKELYEQCENEIHKAERLARQYEYFGDLLAVLDWKRRLVLSQKGLHPPSLQPLAEEEAQIIRKMGRINEYWDLTGRIFEFQKDQDQKLLQYPVMKCPEEHVSQRGKVLYHNLLYVYHTINERAVQGRDTLDTLIELIEQNPDRIREAPGTYVTALNNKISAHISERSMTWFYRYWKK